MDDEFQYPDATRADEYCLLHNFRLEDTYGFCPVCDPFVPLLVSEDRDFEYPPHFLRLSLFYRSLFWLFLVLFYYNMFIWGSFYISILFLGLAIVVYKVSDDIMSLFGSGYHLLGIITAILFTLVWFYWISNNNWLFMAYLSLVFGLASIYVYSNKMVRDIMDLNETLKKKLTKRSDWHPTLSWKYLLVNILITILFVVVSLAVFIFTQVNSIVIL